MKKLSGGVFGSYSLLVSFRTKWTMQSGGSQNFPPETHAIFRQHAMLLAAAFQEVGMRVVAKAATDLVTEIDNAATLPDGQRQFSGQNLGSALGHLNVLAEFLGRDMEDRYLLVTDQNRGEYYEQPMLFGDRVFNSFPSANNDIFEAGTCLALERGTACVMHLMRVVEVGLAALAKTVGVGPQDNMGAYLREIDKELTARYKASGARSLDERFYAEAALTLDRIRRVWRNPTMHVENSYSLDRAEEIVQAVKSFMVHLATRISE